MINDNHELIIEVWSRIKPHIPQKERLEVADTFLAAFDEFGLIDDNFVDEDLDKELRAAARSLLSGGNDGDDEEGEDDYSF
jgi:hypothetical protein